MGDGGTLQSATEGKAFIAKVGGGFGRGDIANVKGKYRHFFYVRLVKSYFVYGGKLLIKLLAELFFVCSYYGRGLLADEFKSFSKTDYAHGVYRAAFKFFGEERGLFKLGGGRTCAAFDYCGQRIFAVGDEQSCACWSIEGFVTCGTKKVETVRK